MAQDGPRSIGRYAVHGEIGSGGMATVYLGRLLGIGGFSRTVAIKRLRPAFAKDPTFAAMLLDEARLASRIRHPNVVSTLDVGYEDGELFIVLDYVHGEPLSRLIPAARPDGVPADVAVAVLAGTLRGLHAAHEARGKDGASLGLVHRDVSPQNVLVGADGIARVLDFGVAKAAGRIQQTRGGEVKGKFAYMAREQLQGGPIDRRADVYSAAVVLWETLVGERLFSDAAPESGPRSFRPPSAVVPSVPEDLDGIVACALSDDREQRFTTAEAMAVALENAVKPASPERVAAWVAKVAGGRLRERAAVVAEVEGAESRSTMPISPAPIAVRETPRSTADPNLGPETAPMTPHPSDPPQRTLLSATVDYDSGRRPPSGPGGSRSRPPVTIADPPAAPGMGLVVIAIVAAIAGAAIVVVLFATSRGSASPAASAPVAAPSSTSTAVATVDPAPLPPANVAGDDAPPPAPSSAGTARVAPRPRLAPKPRPPQPPPQSSCDPPYRIDADGTQHPKPECF